MGSRKREKNSNLNHPPVPPDQSGEGLPYAPINFPEKGDVWGWKTGKRLQANGCYQDRYLYVPKRFIRSDKGRKHRQMFASKLSTERYIQSTFPGSDVDAFFKSFSWRIPSTGINAVPIAAVPLQQVAQVTEPDSDDDKSGVVRCKGRNKLCDSLNSEVVEKYSPAMPCDVCCSESRFCRDCSCILCCKTISSAHCGYGYIKCAVIVDGAICGHVAHFECALRSLLAGTVGQSIGLDAEYMCRRCDGRTDLVPHVERLLQICKAVDLDDEIKKKVLDLGACLLRGSKRPEARELLGYVELALTKLKCVTNGEGSSKKAEGVNVMPHSEDHGTDAMEFTMNETPADVRSTDDPYDYLAYSLKLEAEVDAVLDGLKKSQELEYKVAEERLHAQKAYLQSLYELLDCENSELACNQNSSRSDALQAAVRDREQQIGNELVKFEVMKRVANGFGSTSKDILKEHFGVQMAD